MLDAVPEQDAYETNSILLTPGVRGATETYKEALACPISFTSVYKRKNVVYQVHRFFSLLSSVKQFKSDKDDKSDADRRRSVTKSFHNWLQVFFHAFCNVMGEKFLGLFQHVDIFLETFHNFRGFGWFT